MRAKILCLMLALILTILPLSGCSDKTDAPPPEDASEQVEEALTESTSNEAEKVVESVAENVAEIASEAVEEAKTNIDENKPEDSAEDSAPVEQPVQSTTGETSTPTQSPPEEQVEEPTPEIPADSNETAQTSTVEVTGTYHYEEAYKMLKLVNDYRAQHGVDPVEWDSNLEYASKTRAAEASICWAHSRPDGSAWKTVSEYTHGENLAKGYDTAEQVFQAWLNSPTHRDNMLIPQFKTMNVAFFEAENGWFWAQEFGF